MKKQITISENELDLIVLWAFIDGIDFYRSYVDEGKNVDYTKIRDAKIAETNASLRKMIGAER